MRYQVRIIAGSLRRRKITVTADPDLRPISDRAREALFSILGDAIPDRPFYDVFAGSGAIGIEALSRGAKSAVFVERDPRAVNELIHHLETFGVAAQARVLKADAYRWADKCAVPNEPVNLFLGPPYVEFEKHMDAVIWMVGTLLRRMPPESVLVIQSDTEIAAGEFPDPERWDVRTYGRTRLAIYVIPPRATDETLMKRGYAFDGSQ